MKKVLIAFAMMLALTMGLFAQRGARPDGTPPAGVRGQAPDPTTALKNALNLTDAQVGSIQALFQAQQQKVQAIMTDVNQKRQTLDSLLNAASPNPTDVGNAAIAVHTAEKQMQALHDAFLADLKNQLTADQQATLDTLIKAGAPLPGLGGFGPGGRGMRGPRGGGR